MSKAEVAKFKALFNDWASSDHQSTLPQGGPQHQFISMLLSYRRPIIAALELAARD